MRTPQRLIVFAIIAGSAALAQQAGAARTTGASDTVKNMFYFVDQFSGSGNNDIGDRANAACNSALVPQGAFLIIPDAGTGTPWSYTTPIVCSKYVTYSGLPSGTGIQFTPTSGTAMKLNPGSSHHYGWGVRDLEITGACSTNACSGVTSVGLVLGTGSLATTGGEGFLVSNVKVGKTGAGFLQGISLNNAYTFVGRFSHVSAMGNNIGLNQPNTSNNENIQWDGGAIAQNAHGAQLAGFGDYYFNGVSFDDNTTDALNLAGSVLVDCDECHFENTGGGSGLYVAASDNVSARFSGSLFMEDRPAGTTNPHFISWRGNVLTLIGNKYLSIRGATVTSVANVKAGNGVVAVGNFIANPSVILREISDNWVSGGGRTFSCPIAGTSPPCILQGWQLKLDGLNSSTATVGSGTLLKRYARYTPSLSPARVGPNTTAEQCFSGILNPGDVVVGVSKPTAQAGLGIVGWRAQGTSLCITFSNGSSTPITPTARETYQVVAVQ